MAAGAMDVVVRFIGDASSIQSETAKIESTGGKLKNWAKGVAAAFGTAFVVDQLKDATNAAADLQDVIGATGVVFGPAAKNVERFAKTTSEGFGIAQADALDAADTFGTLFKSAGVAGDDLGKMSTSMVALSGDLASFKGGKPEEAVQALGAALRGESEPIRRYGVLLDDATLRARAMKMGLIQTTKDALTPQQKLLAADIEILAQTGDAQGDFARTSDSAANQQKKMAAQMKETQTAIGTALLPVLQQLLPILQTVAQFFEQNASVLVPLVGVILALVAAVKLWSIAQGILNVVMSANPIGLIVIAIAALIAIIVLIVTHFDTFKEAAATAFNFVLDVVQSVWNWIKDNWPLLLAILTGPFGVAVLIVKDNWNTIKDFFSGLIDSIAAIVGRVISIVTAPFRTAIDTVKSIIGEITGAMGDVINGAKNVWNAFARGWNGITLHIPSVDLPIIGEVGGGSVSLPNLPILGRGGIVSRPTLALIGERGREAVVPLDRGGFGNTTFNIQVEVAPGTAPAAVGAAVVDQIRAYERVAGKAWRAS